MNKTESIVAWAIALSSDSSSFSKDIVLVCVRHSKVTVSLESRVLSLSTSNVVSFEPLTFGVGLFVPNSHVVLSIEIWDTCWHVTTGISRYCGGEVVKVEVH